MGTLQADATLEGPRVRDLLLRRLADIVGLPETQISPHERSMAADLLVDLIQDADPEDKAFVARRLVRLHDVPKRLLKYLSLEATSISGQLLTECVALDDADLIGLIPRTDATHHMAMAQRKSVSVVLSEFLCQTGNVEVVTHLLNNRGAVLSEAGLDMAIYLSRENMRLVKSILTRMELRPSQALTVFWWATDKERRDILQRFGTEREVLIDTCADLFARMAAENWSDPAARKTLQMIERRQRNRGAIARSEYDSLEQIIDLAATSGMTRELAEEIAHLAGIKPLVAAKLMTDIGGEGLAILCKATGLKRPYLERLWEALKRPVGPPEARHPMFAKVELAYDLMAVTKAQTVLRYWNWSLSSAFAERDNDLAGADTVPQATARLVFGK
jgi:uncharacterized protein (DUF2336 family)